MLHSCQDAFSSAHLLAFPQKVLEDCRLCSCLTIVRLTGVIHGNSHFAVQTHVCYILGAVVSPLHFCPNQYTVAVSISYLQNSCLHALESSTLNTLASQFSFVDVGVLGFNLNFKKLFLSGTHFQCSTLSSY